MQMTFQITGGTATLTDSNAKTAMCSAAEWSNLISFLPEREQRMRPQITKKIERQFDHSIKCHINSLFPEAKIIQERMSRTEE